MLLLTGAGGRDAHAVVGAGDDHQRHIFAARFVQLFLNLERFANGDIGVFVAVEDEHRLIQVAELLIERSMPAPLSNAANIGE